MSIKTVALIGVIVSIVSIPFALLQRNWLAALWQLNAGLWAFSAYMRAE